jgi:hypothetical protein
MACRSAMLTAPLRARPEPLPLIGHRPAERILRTFSSVTSEAPSKASGPAAPLSGYDFGGLCNGGVWLAAYRRPVGDGVDTGNNPRLRQYVGFIWIKENPVFVCACLPLRPRTPGTVLLSSTERGTLSLSGTRRMHRSRVRRALTLRGRDVGWSHRTTMELLRVVRGPWRWPYSPTRPCRYAP